MRLLALIPFFLSMHVLGQTCDLSRSNDLARSIWSEVSSEIGSSCRRGNQVHLTFDDGPSQYTGRILDALRARGTKATFFITTTNLEGTGALAETNRQLVREELAAGMVVGDHGYEHNAYDLRMDRSGRVLEPGYTPDQRIDQIDRSVRLLNQATNGQFGRQSPLLYRFPYGRGVMPSPLEIQRMQAQGQMQFRLTNYADELKEYRLQSPALQSIASRGFGHLAWGHDSGDSSRGDGRMSSDELKQYVKTNLRLLCHSPQSPQVALFHDIKAFNVDAIPAIIDMGRCLGLQFVSVWPALMATTSLESGVYISKVRIQAHPVEHVDAIEQLLANLGGPSCQDCEEEKTSCYSQDLGRRVKNCHGYDSVCFQGSWLARSNPLVDLMCETVGEP